MLQSVEAIFVNTHVGITPKYRGVHGGYWSLVKNDKNLIMKRLLATLISIFILGIILTSCVQQHKKCRHAHKHVKKMHLKNWY